MRVRALLAAAAALAIALCAPGASLPPGFTETFVSGLSSPTAMAIAPDGRVFVCQQSGALRVVKNGALLPTPFITLVVDDFFERGLLGIAFDPNFVTNQYVYVYYTVPGSPAHNRVSRLTANGDVAVAGSELPLLNLESLGAGNHNGGALHFGLDGKLYIAVGDNAVSSNAQILTNMKGKILRINSDGSIPPDNPFVDGPGGNRDEIWTLGLRNPFTFGVQPFTGRMFINDVGQNTYEEINDAAPAANYGWPDCEGPFLQGTTNPCTDPDYTNPFHYYSHAGGGCSIAGGDFYNPQVPQFPADYTGDYFFADYCGDWIQRLDPVSHAVTNFATGINAAPVDLRVDFEGNLYYLAYASGRLYKVSYTGSAAPVITENPQSQLRSVGSTATFTVAASGAPTLEYQWQKDSADIAGATSPSYTTPTLGLGDSGSQYRCVVTNDDGSATSDQALLTVIDDASPTATIATPPPGATYAAGDTISYSGSGSDPEDGSLPPSSLTWWVNFHHDTHSHPVLPPTSGSSSGSFVVPTAGETSPNVWYRIHLSVIDSAGLMTEVFRDVLPRTTTMTFETSPTGLQLKLDGQSFTAPISVVGVEGIVRTIEAPTPQGGLDFQSWSDGGARIHNISTPVGDTTYTATFSGPPAPTVSGIAPTSGDAGGGTSVTVSGSGFVTGAALTLGGVPATGVVVVGPGTITGTAPALSGGTLHDVVVDNPGSAPAATLADGWLADFLDVPPSNLFHDDIETIFRAGVTAGCGGGLYCPVNPVTRAQMAVFILKGMHGGDYTAPACTGTVFADVPCPGAQFVDWINQLQAEGVTAGCGGGNYCPANPITRAQMAVFLLRGRNGAAYQPPACSATVFGDVICPDAPYVDWINQLAADGITAGCGGGNYCPAMGTPRGQMSTFIVRTFGLEPPGAAARNHPEVPAPEALRPRD